MPKKESRMGVPLGVKIAAVVLFVLAAMILLLGVMIFVDPVMVRLAFSTAGYLGEVGKSILIMLGILFVAIAVLYAFAGRDLWRGKQWARIAALIIYGIGVVQYLVMIATGDVSSIILLLVYGVIFCYLAFSAKVRAAFSGKKKA